MAGPDKDVVVNVDFKKLGGWFKEIMYLLAIGSALVWSYSSQFVDVPEVMKKVEEIRGGTLPTPEETDSTSTPVVVEGSAQPHNSPSTHKP